MLRIEPEMHAWRSAVTSGGLGKAKLSAYNLALHPIIHASSRYPFEWVPPALTVAGYLSGTQALCFVPHRGSLLLLFFLFFLLCCTTFLIHCTVRLHPFILFISSL